MPQVKLNVCLDKGYDYDDIREMLAQFGFTAHVRGRGEEARKLKRKAGQRARRWVVERTHSWMNRFRRLLIRWEQGFQGAYSCLGAAALAALRCASRRATDT